MQKLYWLAPALGAALALSPPQTAWAQTTTQRTVTGVVTAALDRSPLPGVTVLVKGTTVGATTDAEGRFSVAAPAGSTLIFSFIGYTTQERAVGADGSVDISLKENTTALDDVIVTAFGIKQERRQVNYGAQEVSSKEIIESR